MNYTIIYLHNYIILNAKSLLLIIKHSVYLLIILGLIMIKQEKGNVLFMYLIERETTSPFIMMCKLIMNNSVLNQ